MEADMDSTFRRTLGLAAAAAVLVGLSQIAACTTDEDDPGPEADADASTGGNGSAGASGVGDAGSSSSAGSPAVGNTVCANPAVLSSDSPGIADFEAYDGTDISTWFFSLGGDSSGGLLAGPFVYGDEPDGNPETFGMEAGHDSTYALSIADTLAEEYGGGMGLWISACIDASAFTGISFWVRGSAPNDASSAVITLMMEETTSSTPATADSNVGTCPGDEETCKQPNASFVVTDAWTEIRLDWSDFTGGQAPNTTVSVDGRNIWQIQFDIGVEWVEGDPEYVPVPAPYELVVDDLTFY
jgi:hypothetical protein